MNTFRGFRRAWHLLTGLILLVPLYVGFAQSSEELESVDYTPLPRENWTVSTPAEQGLDPRLVAELYYDAAKLDSLYGLLVVKNGHMIAEGYFNGGAIEQKLYLASATKSITSALVGIALDQGYLVSADQPMMDFFQEYTGQLTDSRKNEITIQDLLQMRSGYVWEERTPPYMEVLFTSQGSWLPLLVDFPLTNDPGDRFSYSNLTSHLLSIIVARACFSDLQSYAQKNLFSPIDVEIGIWDHDADNYYFGSHGISLSARDRAQFGLLFLRDGRYNGNQVISAGWVEDSLETYSRNINISGWLPGVTSRYGYFRDIGYGYQWWSAKAGNHRFNYASGHGGNLIILLKDLDMVIVTSADRLFGEFGAEAWDKERSIIEVVGKFIKSLPDG